MEINNLPKRSEVKHAPRSESAPEHELYAKLIVLGFRGERQYPVGKYFIDIAFPEEHLAIEYDGIAYHGDLEKDVSREIEIIKAGYDVVRLGKTEWHGYALTGITKKGVKELGWFMDYDTAMTKSSQIIGGIVENRLTGQRLNDYVTGKKYAIDSYENTHFEKANFKWDKAKK